MDARAAQGHEVRALESIRGGHEGGVSEPDYEAVRLAAQAAKGHGIRIMVLGIFKPSVPEDKRNFLISLASSPEDARTRAR